MSSSPLAEHRTITPRTTPDRDVFTPLERNIANESATFEASHTTDDLHQPNQPDVHHFRQNTSEQYYVPQQKKPHPQPSMQSQHNGKTYRSHTQQSLVQDQTLQQPTFSQYTETPRTNVGDPEVTKMTSSLWRRAGQFQATLGTWTGVESWEKSGRSTESWADDAFRQATEKSESGDPSRVHGEYNRWMGRVGKVIGHIAGDPEMEAKASMRVREGEEEIGKLQRRGP